ncbi:unnamed protein product [Phytophthora fragariaefolia]|uniref:Unnamed protein product n=1 Tax=Phytophthora fragariaefolia TaxID=1490495 RepID=A0A9W6XX55_9STRA|nr:unnamed protein product [Phytophthora fragariaefolia]
MEYNRRRSGHRGVSGIKHLKLEDGFYIVGASNAMGVGHAFVLEVQGRNSGLLAILMQLWLTSIMTVALLVANPSSLSNRLRKISSCMQWHNAMYSASVVECTTLWCFLESHKIGLAPIIVTYPPTDLLVSGQLA